jgi:precorrin-2 dehydrogenase/sirohydrochlorin ferrochelatase
VVPIILDPATLDIALIGGGPPLAARRAWLAAAGAARLRVLGPAATAADLAGARVVWITGLDPASSARLAALARAAGALVNVEDDRPHCDFHTPAVVRRGDLLLTVSTGGKSPGLAQRVRAWLEASFGPEWEERLERLAAKRAAWRRRPRSLPELARLTAATLDRQGWLAPEPRA